MSHSTRSFNKMQIKPQLNKSYVISDEKTYSIQKLYNVSLVKKGCYLVFAFEYLSQIKFSIKYVVYNVSGAKQLKTENKKILRLDIFVFFFHTKWSINHFCLNL